MKDNVNLSIAEQKMADAMIIAQKSGIIHHIGVKGLDAEFHRGTHLEEKMKLQKQFDRLCEASHAHSYVERSNAQSDMVERREIVAKQVVVKALYGLDREQAENVSRALNSMAKWFDASLYLTGKGIYSQEGIGGQEKELYSHQTSEEKTQNANIRQGFKL